VGIGAALGAIALIVILLLLWRRKQKSNTTSPAAPVQEYYATSELGWQGAQNQNKEVYNYHGTQELDGRGYRGVQELEGRNVYGASQKRDRWEYKGLQNFFIQNQSRNYVIAGNHSTC
jgi:hypothetical protein